MRLRFAILVVLGLAASLGAESSTRAPATQPTPGKAGPGVLEETYDSGKLKARYSLNPAGVKWGAYSLFSEEGKITERGSYKNGQLDGQRRTLYPNGQVQTVETYRMGVFDGQHQLYYPNGHVQLQEMYKAGQRDGILQEYDDKGHVVRVAQYKAVIGTDGKGSDSVPVSDQTRVNGVLIFPRSQEMITRELARIAAAKVPTAPASATIPPHDGTGDTPESREEAVRKLMQYRYLSNVPYENMALDPVYCAHDEAATAILNAIGKLDHTPANPGWPNDKYKFAYAGTSHSNLYGGGGPNGCRDSINAYMDDSDSSNIDRVGHRRWCLNPPMGKVGIASSGHFSAMWSMDSSRRQVPDYDFVAYPAPGHYPSNFFRASRAWSVSLNPSKYATPRESDIKVTITPVEVHLAENTLKPAGKPLEIKYLHVDTVGYGIPNCIIFQPANLVMDDGNAYVVEIAGVKANRAQASNLVYLVQFFEPDKKAEKLQSAE
ncbi:MAG TPA: toxin-antitoxin system YwqK family antitoxin [Tepidisphaeraceae bacterium]|nr:toxin-antitoxin system YwqK family antitoxin [Tepidisphaeraceae bacterium]